MQQIRELADMLTGTVSPPAENSGNADDDSVESFDSFPAADPKPQENIGGNTDTMIDPAMLMKIIGIFNRTSANDSSRTFLLALRPFLKEDNRRKLDKAVKFLRIYEVYKSMRQSGMLNQLDDLF